MTPPEDVSSGISLHAVAFSFGSKPIEQLQVYVRLFAVAGGASMHVAFRSLSTVHRLTGSQALSSTQVVPSNAYPEVHPQVYDVDGGALSKQVAPESFTSHGLPTHASMLTQVSSPPTRADAA